ncbi:hypothetical protein LTR86_007797 [Recurvomyces mirabilis]|nr:hypothetical protein LTR86_007797 [Recurvomyces mirabilis]
MSIGAKTLEGKVALVTGSGRGMGAAIVLKYASHGADVVINYHSSADAAEHIAETARSCGVRAICVKRDVSKAEDIKHLFEDAKKEFGKIDIVYSNSGIEHFDEVDKVTVEAFDKVFAINVRGQFLVAQQAYEHLSNDGRLILMSSISAVWGLPRHAIYAASKAAITGMVKCLAWDFGKRNITVNCIAPGGIKTDMYTEAAKDYFPGGDQMSEEEIDKTISGTAPLGRPGYPDDIAGLAALIASPEAKWMTGQTFHCSGGAYMGTA